MLAAQLARHGFSVWWDQHIQFGAEFARDIEAELDAAKAVIVCWSAAAKQSRWVKDEASAGAEAGKLLTLTLDGESPPIGFRQFHCADFTRWRGNSDDQTFQKFITAVKARVANEKSPLQLIKIRNKTWTDKLLKPVPIAIAAIVMLAVVGPLAWFANGDRDAQSTVENSLQGTPRIAVAPIKVIGDNFALTSVAAALRDEIASGLSKFSMLAVAARGHEANASYRLDVTMQKSDDTLRITGRLLNLSSGEEVWGVGYDRETTGLSALEIQADLTDHLVASVADPYGGLMRDLHARIDAKDPTTLTPYEALLRLSLYNQRLSAEDHLIARSALERAAEITPNSADVWAALAQIYNDEYKFGFNELPDSRERALAAAERALAIDRNNAFVHLKLAEVYFFRQNLSAFRAAAERAIELNPRDSDALAQIGAWMGYAGDWERGVALTERAITLNPNHPGWYWFILFFNEYRQAKYETALEFAQRVNLPDYHAAAYILAMTHAQLGQIREAEYAAERFHELWPGDLATYKTRQLDSWLFAQPELTAQIIEGLQKAGLEFSEDAP